MEDLMTIIAEANENVAELKKNWKNDDDVIKHYTPFFERAKKHECNNLSFFITICVQSLKMSQMGMPLAGGAFLTDGKETSIHLK